MLPNYCRAGRLVSMLVTSRALWTPAGGFRPTLTPAGGFLPTLKCTAAGHRAGKRMNACSCRLQSRRLVTCAEEALEGKTIVLLSGGVESTTLLYSMHQQAEAAGGEVLALFSDYGQRGGEQERQASRAACLKLGIELVELHGGEVCRFKAFAAECRMAMRS